MAEICIKTKRKKEVDGKLWRALKIVYEGERLLESIYTPTEDGTHRSYFTPDGGRLFW